MRRLAATFVCDLRLQFRNGFYLAAGGVAMALILILRQLPAPALLPFLPVLLVSNLLMGTFYFIAGLVLLEKREGTLLAQRVTPLRAREYLAAKILSLTMLALFETILITALGGFSFHPLALVLGIGFAGLILSLFGFVSVSGFSSINEYLFPSFLITLIFVPPFLHSLRVFETDLNFLHPLQPPLVLVGLAFGDRGGGGWLYGILGSLIWTAVASRWAQRAFDRLALEPEGGTP